MRRSILPSFFIAGAIFAELPAFGAGTLKKESGGAVRHVESGWTFPAGLGAFKRVQQTAFKGSDDVAASYERGGGADKIVATVYVYPAASPALDGSYEGAKTAIAARLRGGAMNQLWSEGPFLAGGDRRLVGRKAFYKIGIGPQSTLTNLYHYDTGLWTVKIRVSAARIVDDTGQVADAFVRSLPWASLQYGAAGCTGFSCNADRPMAIHAMIPEALVAMTAAKLTGLSPQTAPACRPEALVTGLAAAPKAGKDGKVEPVENLHSCLADDRKVSFFRFNLPDEVFAKLAASPDGLTYRRPISFAVARDKSGLHFAAGILARIRGGSQIDFATADDVSGSAPPKLITRFIR